MKFLKTFGKILVSILLLLSLSVPLVLIYGISKQEMEQYVQPPQGSYMPSAYGEGMIVTKTDIEEFITVSGNLSDIETLSGEKVIIFSSDKPAAIREAAIAMGFETYGTVYELKERAIEQKKMNIEMKAIIAMVLCVLLAINLYGSFSNALQSRKFEVGVKRAIGASKWAIIRQFLLEGMIVMSANIWLSIMIIMNIALGYKYLYQMINNEVWTIYITPSSIAIFGVVTLSLTLIFSLVFAIQTTQVEIVQYLKAE